MYRVKVKKTGIGYELVLYKKFIFIWLPDTISVIRYGYENLAENKLTEWCEKLGIPEDNFFGCECLK